MRSSALWDYTDWDGPAERVMVGGSDSREIGCVDWDDWVAGVETALEEKLGRGGFAVQGLWPTASGEMYVCVAGRGDAMAGCCEAGAEAGFGDFEVGMDDAEEFQAGRPTRDEAGLDGVDDPTLLLRLEPMQCGACGAEPAEKLDAAVWATVAAEVRFWRREPDGGAMEPLDPLNSQADRKLHDAATIELPQPKELAAAVGHEIADAAYASRMRAFDTIFALYQVGPGPEDFPQGDFDDDALVAAAAAGTRRCMAEHAGETLTVDSAGSTFYVPVRAVEVMTAAEFTEATDATRQASSQLATRHKVVCVVAPSEAMREDRRCFDLCFMVLDDTTGEAGFVEHSRHKYGLGPDVETAGATRVVYFMGDSEADYSYEVVAAEQARLHSINPAPSVQDMIGELGL